MEGGGDPSLSTPLLNQASFLYIWNFVVLKHILCACITGNWSLLFVIFPRPKIMLVNIMYCSSPVKYEISSSMPGRPDDPSRVLRWQSVSVSRDWCWVRTKPPLTGIVIGSPIYTGFLALNPQYPKSCHMELWLARLTLTHHEWVALSYQWYFSLAGCLFPFFG